MEPNNSQNESKGKPNAFTIINNVRNNCKQPVSKKLLMLTLATYCDRDGICWPRNDTLVSNTRQSERTIRRMLKQLAADGELEILTPGRGRDQKRIISLKRYALPKPDKVVTCLNRPRPLGKVSRNNHREQPTKQNTLKGRYTHGLQSTGKKEEVFQGKKDKAIHGGNGNFIDNSKNSGAQKRGAKIPIAQRNKIIDRLNQRKASLYRDASLTHEERERALDKVNSALQKL